MAGLQNLKTTEIPAGQSGRRFRCCVLGTRFRYHP